MPYKSRFPRIFIAHEFTNHYNYFSSQFIHRPLENIFHTCVTNIMDKLNPLPPSDEHKCERLLRTILHALPKYKEDFYKDRFDKEGWLDVENDEIHYLKNAPYETHFIHRRTFHKIFYGKNMEQPEKNLYDIFAIKMDYNSSFRCYDINNCRKVLGGLLPQLVIYTNEKYNLQNYTKK